MAGGQGGRHAQACQKKRKSFHAVSGVKRKEIAGIGPAGTARLARRDSTELIHVRKRENNAETGKNGKPAVGKSVKRKLFLAELAVFHDCADQFDGIDVGADDGVILVQWQQFEKHAV